MLIFEKSEKSAVTGKSGGGGHSDCQDNRGRDRSESEEVFKVSSYHRYRPQESTMSLQNGSIRQISS